MLAHKYEELENSVKIVEVLRTFTCSLLGIQTPTCIIFISHIFYSHGASINRWVVGADGNVDVVKLANGSTIEADLVILLDILAN